MDQLVGDANDVENELRSTSLANLRRTAVLLFRFITSLAVGGEAARRKHEASAALETAAAAAKRGVDKRMVPQDSGIGTDKGADARSRSNGARGGKMRRPRLRVCIAWRSLRVPQPARLTLQLQQLAGQLPARELAIALPPCARRQRSTRAW